MLATDPSPTERTERRPGAQWGLARHAAGPAEREADERGERGEGWHRELGERYRDARDDGDR